MRFPDFFDQTFLGLGKLFPARESLIYDTPVGDQNFAKPFLQCGREPIQEKQICPEQPEEVMGS